jgi:hypothetical protein
LALHCAQADNCGALARLAALRVRNRIFDIRLFGTPMKLLPYWILI